MSPTIRAIESLGRTRYRWVADLGDDPTTGKRRQVTRTFDDREEAERVLARTLEDAQRGVFTPDNGSIFRRCTCTEVMTANGQPVLDRLGRPRRRELGTACPKLVNPTHGKWGYQVDLPRVQGQRRRRERRTGFFTSEAAQAALTEAWAEAKRKRDASMVMPLGDIVARWLKSEQLKGRGKGTSHRPLPSPDSKSIRIPVALLLDSERCHPLCLLAMEIDEEACSCRCEGEFHGTLVDAKIAIPLPQEEEAS